MLDFCYLIFIRRDGFTSSPTAEEIQQMSLKSLNLYFDTQLTDYLFDKKDFTKFYEFAFQKRGSYPTEKELESLGFFSESKRLYYGAYLFSDRYFGNNSKIVCTFYPGKNKGESKVLDSISFIGNLIDAFNFISDFVDKYEKHGFIKLSDSRIDTVSYPERSVFEAIVNSLAHRDYSIDYSQISVDMFSNRLVITSPGSFYGKSSQPITYDLTSFASKRRNELISFIFVYLKSMEPKKANELYEYFMNGIKEEGIEVKKGEFGEDMLVEINNDGPVTIIIDSKLKE